MPRLHPITAADLPHIHAGLGDPRVTRHYGVHYDSLEATQAQMDWYAALERDGTGQWWGIRDEDGTFLGTIGFNGLQSDHRKAEIGFWLLHAHWGKGIIGQVMPQALAHGFTQLGLHRIEAIVESGNAASSRVLQRHGFNHEGTLRETEWKHERWIDLEVWALVGA
ncbi:MAG: GNAT family N-acetyltransferase [Flavobacteriales bacterium]|nr:GNAT family N-acetyltransferase [Flavobacteriales bacterium]